MLWVNLPVADIIDLSCISTNNGNESGGQKFSKGMKMSTPSSLWCYCSYSVCTEVECGKSPNLLTKHQVCYGCDWIVRRFSNEYTVLHVAFFVGDILIYCCYAGLVIRPIVTMRFLSLFQKGDCTVGRGKRENNLLKIVPKMINVSFNFNI